jgi:hypothetical protein
VAGVTLANEPDRPLVAGLLSRSRRIASSPVALTIVAAAVFVARRPGMFVSPFSIPPYAEDGAVYFKDAIEQGGRAIFEPYNGQIFILQRLVAFAAALFPARVQPSLYEAVAVAGAVLCCSIALSTRWRSSIPLGARFVCMLALLCSPAVDETYGALAGLHSWLSVGLVLMGLLYDPISRRLKAGELTFAAATALSGFAAVYAIPVLLARAVRNGSRHSLLLLGVAVGGIVVQLGVLSTSARHGDTASLASQPVTDVLVLAKRVFGTAALGDANLVTLWPARQPEWWVWILLAALLAALAVIWARAPRLEAGALLATLLGSWILALWGFTLPGVDLSMAFWPMGASRYFLVPVAAIYVSLILLWPSTRLQRAALGLACLVLAFGIFSDYRLYAVHSADWPSFAACVQQAETTCSTVIPPGWTLEVDPTGH